MREKYRADLTAGVVVYPLNRRDAWDPVVFSGSDLYSDWSTTATERWDQVWLAIPSTALRQGWLGEMVAAVGDAQVVARAKSKGAPWFTTLIRPWLLGLVVRVTPTVMPFDLERFFEVHFTKIEAPTRLLFKTYARRGAELGILTKRLFVLPAALAPADSGAPPAADHASPTQDKKESTT